MNNTELIGKKIEYEAGGQIHIGWVLDKFTVLSQRNGIDTSHDLYLVGLPDGRTFKISPMQVKRVLTDVEDKSIH